MPKLAKELSPLEVRRLTKPGMHAVGGVAGLYLQVLPSGSRSWILRASIGGKRRDIGLGGFSTVTLAQAREKAREDRDKIARGIDPVAERTAARSALTARQSAETTFDECARQFIEAKSAEWRNSKHVQQWQNTLDAYASPVIGSLHVGDIELSHIVKILTPIWTKKTETASRLRGRIESVLDWATVRGLRKGDNPARWRGHLDKLLPKPSKVKKVEHHTALAIDELGAFMKKLQAREGMSARALEFLILTAARSGEVRGATWNEIDLDAGIWTVPAERMKAGREHRVPLCRRTVDLLNELPRIDASPLVFPAPRGGELSDMSLVAVMRRMKSDAVPHGFRSTFRDWAAERTNYPREVAEIALAHTIESKVEAAYRRGDLFGKRRRMMEEWARFCATESQSGAVVPLNANAQGAA